MSPEPIECAGACHRSQIEFGLSCIEQVLLLLLYVFELVPLLAIGWVLWMLDAGHASMQRSRAEAELSSSGSSALDFFGVKPLDGSTQKSQPYYKQLKLTVPPKTFSHSSAAICAGCCQRAASWPFKFQH